MTRQYADDAHKRKPLSVGHDQFVDFAKS